MAKKNEQVQQPQEPQPTSQPPAPATPLELNDEELEQVVGGCTSGQHAPTGIGGLPVLIGN